MNMEDEVTLKISRAELLVLGEFFDRLSNIAEEESLLDGKTLFQSKAELGAIWNFQCVLERMDKEGDIEDAKSHLIQANFDDTK